MPMKTRMERKVKEERMELGGGANPGKGVGVAAGGDIPDHAPGVGLQESSTSRPGAGLLKSFFSSSIVCD